MWDQGSEGCSGIWDQSLRFRDFKQAMLWIGISSFLKDQGSGCNIIVETGIKICHAFGIEDEKFGYKNGIIDENTYHVTTLIKKRPRERQRTVFVLKGLGHAILV